MDLTDWQRSGWLVAHETTPQEVANLLGLADRDLKDSLAGGLSADARLRLACNAALQAAVAALAAAGFRVAPRESHHYRALQSLAHTIGAPKNTIDQLDAFRKKRNVADYERAGAVSDQETQEMITLARRIRREVGDWLRATHPSLLKKW